MAIEKPQNSTKKTNSKKISKQNEVKKTKNVKTKSTSSKNNLRKVTKTKRVNKTQTREEKTTRRNIFITIVLIFLLGTLFIISSYAWFSTTLNVKIKSFNMLVTKNEGLSLSFDAINYDQFQDISEEILFSGLGRTYPNHLSQWPTKGLIPISSPGIINKNSYFFDMYSGGDGVNRRIKHDSTITVFKVDEDNPKSDNDFIAFDIFLKNETDSPISDQLYFDEGTGIIFAEDAEEQMQGILNSTRIGIVKVGTVPLNTDPKTVQNLQCHNDCESIIYEPYSSVHTRKSINRAQEYNITLEDGVPFPTYAYIKDQKEFAVKDTVSGSPNLDLEYFKLQRTITDKDLDKPLFEIPNGITKVRVYVWIEGQDIDSLETSSDGATIAISINFVKDLRSRRAQN